ncbi:DNA polymerase clamp loader subunit A [Candidatus Dojkabacteria bacterium]|jgi:hypothetical protein|nr:DNA polymerase clamp loader subunit A [Candidatus Dojkabacteria bacterium]
MSSPFDYVKEIQFGKKQLIVDDITEKEYNPFIVNRALSYYKDCIMQSNEMNKRTFLDKKLQFDFLINTVRSHKRPFVKWEKPETIDDLECVKLFFGFSDAKARDALRILNKEQIKEIQKKTSTGGLRK